jgi:hypothetical protein
MKRAVSVSIGSSKRNKTTEIELLGESVTIQRIGTDGDMEKAARLYQELDGQVDAFWVGGTDLGLMVDNHWYPMYSILKLIKNVHHTPIVDGTGLKTTLEMQAPRLVKDRLGQVLKDKSVLLVTASDRWGLTTAFLDEGFRCLFGDMMFALGLPVELHSPQQVIRFARLLLPIASRLPFKWIYPVGPHQDQRTPKWEKQFHDAEIIAGDCHYIKRYIPDHMDGKIIVTNTTTEEDRELFKQVGVRYLVTTTPVLDGRSFGTNMMEAAIVAALGRKTQVDYSQPGDYFEIIRRAVADLHMEPQLQAL